jgi:hypothetical protein
VAKVVSVQTEVRGFDRNGSDVAALKVYICVFCCLDLMTKSKMSKKSENIQHICRYSEGIYWVIRFDVEVQNVENISLLPHMGWVHTAGVR